MVSNRRNDLADRLKIEETGGLRAEPNAGRDSELEEGCK